MTKVLPTTLFPGYQVATDSISFPLANTNGITAANADIEEGDGREIIRSLVETAYQGFNNIPASDRPKGMNITKSAPNFATNDKMEVTYTLTFSLNLDSAAIPLVQEPV